jgi:[acyl-carrier-protein] S-malonyltransferase
VDTLGIKPDFVVGHSVGEYSALAAAASLSDRDAIALVRERGACDG